MTILIFPVVVQSQAKPPVDITINRDGILLQGKFFFLKDRVSFQQ
jgi:hypothetical protein